MFLDRDFDEIPIILGGDAIELLDQLHQADTTSLDSVLSAIQVRRRSVFINQSKRQFRMPAFALPPLLEPFHRFYLE